MEFVKYYWKTILKIVCKNTKHLMKIYDFENEI